MGTMEKRDLSLYVHIPFCKAKCAYCDFLSFGGCSYSEHKQYVDALCKEIEAYKSISVQYVIHTIFIGGGTPSFVDGSFIKQIMDTIKETFDVDMNAEITIEGNPDSLSKDKLQMYRDCGINRLSIGLQSANDETLRNLNRVHNYDQFIAAYSSGRQVGFDNINIDLMSGLPGESMESYIHTLAKVVELQPEHISAYSLIVEDGTPLSENETLLDMLPTEEEDRKLYAKTKLLLQNSGYNRYEISNYAKPGYACRHNIVYWTGGEYLGVGLGAASYLNVPVAAQQWEVVRFHGVENMTEYIGRFSKCEGMREDSYTSLFHMCENLEEEYKDCDLSDAMEDFSYDETYDMYDNMEAMLGMSMEESCMTDSSMSKYQQYEENALLEFLRDYYKDLYFSKRKDQMEEFMFLGLRMIRGVGKTEFRNRFGVEMESIYDKVITKYKQQGLLLEENGWILLSDKGIDVSNVVMAEFML